MNRKDAIVWLYQEMPELVRFQILDQASVERLRNHYGPVAREGRRSLGLVICAGIGALLVGLGIMLLLAHNWTDLSRPQRTVLSFLPLVLGQGLAGWTWLKKRSSSAWCEGSATFLFLAVGASIALVGQTYHIPGDLPRFLLVWMLLGLPLVYLFRAALPTLLYWAGVTWWSVLGADDRLPVMFFWLLMALPLPFGWQLLRSGQRRLAAAWLAWVLALCLPIGLGCSTHAALKYLWVPLYLGLFAVCYLLAGRWSGAMAVSRPFRLLGGWGTVGLMLLLSVPDVWQDLARHALPAAVKAAWPEYLLLALLLLATTVLLGRALVDHRWLEGMFGLAPLLITLQLLAGPQRLATGVSLISVNLYLLILGGLILRDGLQGGRLPRINAGLGILSALIAVRFFDSQLPFTLRGLLFILIGCAFLTVNLLVKRREGRP